MTRRFREPPCTGTVQPYSGDYDDAVFNLLAAAKQVRDNGKPILLDHAIEDLETWMENAGETPYSMGWVGRDGRP